MTIGIACFITNEAPYLAEWIELHRLVGFDRFLIFDNESTDQPETILQPYIKAGFVEYYPWINPYGPTRFHQSQLAAYNKAIQISRGRLQWLAILDTDEFLFPAEATPIKEIMPTFEAFGGIAVNWQTFGTSAVWDLQPGECLVEKLLWKRPANHPGNAHVKSLFQPHRVQAMDTQHSCRYEPGYYAVNTDGIRVEGPHSLPVRWDLLRINHYMFRTERFFTEQKIPLMKKSQRYEKRRKVLEDQAAFQAERDTTILRFLPALKTALKRPHRSN